MKHKFAIGNIPWNKGKGMYNGELTKICHTCKKEKSIDQYRFFKSGRNKGRVYGSCRKCLSEYHEKWMKRTGYAKTDKYRKRIREYHRKYDKEHIEKCYARNKSKDLKRKSRCEICNSKKRLQKHHPDYTKPKEIKTLCHQCHLKIHWRII